MSLEEMRALDALKTYKELEAAKQQIKQLQAVLSDPQALWTNWLRGTVALPAGIGDVRQYQERIKRLEDVGDKMEIYCDTILARDWKEAKEAKP